MVMERSRMKFSVPMKEKKIKKSAPTSSALLLATLVALMVCMFSVRVVEPVPEPQSPANMPQKPSTAIPLLTIAGVGGWELTNIAVEW